MAADAGRRRGRRGFPADRRTGLALRHRHVAGEGRAPERRHDCRRGEGHRDRGRERPRARRRHRPRPDRLREARDLRRPVVARDRPHGRGQHSARLGAAPISHHRDDRRRDAEPADAARSRPSHLLEGGGRRAGDGRLRAQSQAVGRGRPSRQFRVPAAGRRSGAFRAAARTRRRSRSGHAVGRHQAVHQRTGKLHARRELHPRRSAGGARHLCRRRLQRLRHRVGRRRRHGARRMGRQGRAALRSLAGRHPPLRPQPSRHELGAHAHARGLRQALHHGLAVRGVSLRAAAAPLAALRQAQGGGRLLRREARLGTAELVCRSGERGEGRGYLQLRAAELVRCRRPRAQGIPRARRRVRPDLVRQVPVWSAAMRKRRCRGSPPTMWRSRRATSSTRRC